jgi:ABC-type transporter Mla maintaining outer membrane lipid asymmetry ATPase subunit MlaF
MGSADTIAAGAPPDAPPAPRAAPAVLELRGVHAATGDRTVLAGVSFAVAPAEIVCVLIAGGSGRSAFARVAAGLVAPERGAVLFEGRDLSCLSYREARAFARRRGYAFGGDPGLQDGLDLAENVAFPLRYHGVPRREALDCALAALAELDIARHARALPHEVPPGVRARAAIARALAPAPRLVVFDDPFPELLPAEYDLVEAAVRRARAQAATAFVVASSHLAFVYRVPDRLLALRNGELIAAGPREDVLASRDPRVRDIAAGRG